jgi:hypothetical protein
LDITDLEHADLYAGAVLRALPEAARTYLEASMAGRERRFHLDFLQESYERGEAKGEAKAVLAVLRARGIDVPEDTCEEIAACTDTALLETWIERAVTVDSVHELFDIPDAA